MKQVLATIGSVVLSIALLGCPPAIQPPVNDIVNSAPLADAGGAKSGVVDEAITFDAGGSSDPDGDALIYAWDFGDGAAGAGVSVSNAYSAAGEYTVRLTVRDPEGLSDEDTASVVVFEGYTLSGSWDSLTLDDAFIAVADPSALGLDPANDALFDPAFYPNDPLFGEQWNLARLDMPAVWAAVTGDAAVVVAILDTGIDQTAPDLQGVSFVSGWNLVADNANTSDFAGHGTHVAGTIAQATNDAYGVAGMAHGVSLMPVKVIDDDMSSSSALLAAGINWAVANGADVINMSIGDPEAGTPDGWDDVLAALESAVASGVTVVGASGNLSADSDLTNDSVRYPAAFDEVIAVGAVDYTGDRAVYSNYGPALDIVAPGGGSLETEPAPGLRDAILQQTNAPFAFPHATESGFGYLAGTSQAAPHVSALAALLKSHKPDLTAQQIRHAIESTAIDLGDPGWDQFYGFGLIDPVAALSYGINDYHSVTDLRSGPLWDAPGYYVWTVRADAGIISLTLTVSELTADVDLLLYDHDGNLVARGVASDDEIRLTYDVKLLGQEYRIAVAMH